MVGKSKAYQKKKSKYNWIYLILSMSLLTKMIKIKLD